MAIGGGVKLGARNGPGGGKAVQRMKRGLRHVLRAGLAQAQFAVLLGWYRLMGPPRVLTFSPEVNARLLRAFGARVGRLDVRLEPPITIKVSRGDFRNLTIEDGCIVSGNVLIDLTEAVTLERGASLGPGCIVMTHNAFNGNPFLTTRLPRLVGQKPVLVKAGAGIKANAVILHGVTVGEEAVVAGASVVARSVPRRGYVSGIPAVLRRSLEKDES